MTAMALTPESSIPRETKDSSSETALRVSVIASTLLHALVILVSIFGLPYLRKDIPPIETAVAVEISTVADMPTTDRPPVEARRTPEPTPPKPAEPKPPELRSSPPKVEASAPPKLTEPTPPVLKEKVAEEKPDDVPPPPPKDAKKDPPKKAPPKESPNKMPDKDLKAEAEAFASVLKNLTPSAPLAPAPRLTDPAARAQPSPSPVAPMGAQVTAGELDALRNQLAGCWNMQAGARYAEDIVVEVRIFVNPDRSVRDAQILDQFRYGTDNYFRAAADSALRAVFNPMCNPLDLPPEKYDQWQTITVNFDPRDMLQ